MPRITPLGIAVTLALAVGACRYNPRELGPGHADTDEVHGDPVQPLEFNDVDWVTPAQAGGPGQTWGPALAYHGSRKTVMMYGGGPIFAGARAELWELQGDTWAVVCESCAPGPLYAASLVYDSWRDRLLLFGGSRSFSEPQTMSAVWSFDGRAWTRLAADNPGPTARWGMAAGFDDRRGVYVVYGGETDGYEPLADLWELHGNEWVGPIAVPGGPGIRPFAGGTYSWRLGALLVYGGAPGLDDMWAWSGASWARLCTSCTDTPRWYTALAHVPQGPLLLVGGWTGSAELAGTMSFDGEQFLPLLPNPTPRDSMGIAYDAHNERLVVFGGNGDGCDGDCAETLFLTIPSQ